MMQKKVEVIREAMTEHIDGNAINAHHVGGDVAYSMVEALEMDYADKHKVAELLAHIGLSEDDVENALQPILDGLIRSAGVRLAQTRAHHVPEHCRETLIKVLTAAGKRGQARATVNKLLDAKL